MRNKNYTLLLLLGILFTFGTTTALYAQTSPTLKALQNLIKQKKADEALRMAGELRKDSTQLHNSQLYPLSVEAALLKYSKENEKIYLQRSPDTLSFFRALYAAYDAALFADSLQNANALSPKDWKRFTKVYAPKLAELHFNLCSAVTHFAQHNKWQETLNYAELSLRSGEKTFLHQVGLNYSLEAQIHDAMYHLTAACKLQQFQLAQRYATLALQEKSRHENTLIQLCQSNEALGDSVALYRYLQIGIATYPQQPFFAAQLSQYYFERNNTAAILQFTHKLLDKDSLNLNLHHLQAAALLQQKNFPLLVESAKKMLRCDSLSADAYYYLGLGYIEQARSIILPTSFRSKNYGNRHQAQQKLYQQARQPLEVYRKLRPDDEERWHALLFEIYLKLNLNREFEQLSTTHFQ